MTFDSTTRSILQRLVTQARKRLVEEFTGQLQETYGIQPDGTMLDLSALDPLDDEVIAHAGLLRDRIQHLAAVDASGKAAFGNAVERYVREQAFTFLHRLAALRLCEERGLVQESVRRGYDSQGFRVYEQVGGPSLGEHTYARYALFLRCLFDELAMDPEIGALFDRYSPFGLLFPREPTLLALLALINAPQLAPLWAADETIGWIYQYFNVPEERRAMREFGAPRNSRELAVRNQFFTPRYVVEFLTDNTLGRLWYEMREGRTRLTHHCRYLVHRRASEAAGGLEAEYHPRPKKDPREIRILDPACGSGHFLLYAFDLLLTLYEEAWGDPDSPPSQSSGRTLRMDYGSEGELRRAIPALILENNLYGIDIDPRAVQIAALALWLRAQRTWQEQGLKAAERPRIERCHIVCAEPMPGHREMLASFTETLRPRLLGQIVDRAVREMRHAGEIGSLLRMEREIESTLIAAKAQWRSGSKEENLELFPEHRRPRQGSFDLSDITDEEFWHQAEAHIYNALREYARAAGHGMAYRRSLFAQDAVQGFAFIDLCRTRFDVVLMNPPFGESSQGAKSYITRSYPRSKNDLLAAFVERGLEWLEPGGMLGAITSRTGFFLTSFQKWREEVVLGMGQPVVVADLGYGVMDAAMVEAAAYVIERRDASQRLQKATVM
jgi:23S rRNA G2445 N2-methylase RlmL